MRKLYEINAYQFLKFINHPDASKFEGQNDSAFVDLDDEDQMIHYNYEGHPNYEDGGTGLAHDLDIIKEFLAKHGREID